MPTHFLSIQGSYTGVQVALFADGISLEIINQNDIKASSHLVPLMDALLKKHELKLHDLSFIAIDKGPGAFTSLRVGIATVNGIAFAQKIPLIGIDGLDCLCEEVLGNLRQTMHNGLITCLLNAYHNDVYAGIYTADGQLIFKGCKNIDELIKQFESDYLMTPIFFTGNGTDLHHEQIKTRLPGAIIDQNMHHVSSAEAIGLAALKRWNQGERSIYKVDPLYLKTQMFTPRKQ